MAYSNLHTITFPMIDDLKGNQAIARIVKQMIQYEVDRDFIEKVGEPKRRERVEKKVEEKDPRPDGSYFGDSW